MRAGFGTRRRLGALVSCGVLAVLCAACGSSGTHFGSSQMRQRVSQDAMHVVNSFGQPVAFDHIGCNPPKGGSLRCYGTGTNVPVRTIGVTFTRTSSGSSCPGVLTVTYGSNVLSRKTVNPCR